MKFYGFVVHDAQQKALGIETVSPCMPERGVTIAATTTSSPSPANMVLRIFLRVIAQTLQSSSPGAATVDKAALHIGAVAFIHRSNASLNEQVHFGYGVPSPAGNG